MKSGMRRGVRYFWIKSNYFLAISSSQANFFSMATFVGSRSVRLFTEVRRLMPISSIFSLRRWLSFFDSLASRRAIVALRRHMVLDGAEEAHS